MTIKARDILTSLRWNAINVDALDITKMNVILGFKRREEINPTLWRKEKKKLLESHNNAHTRSR